jgi:hypothetical protein
MNCKANCNNHRMQSCTNVQNCKIFFEHLAAINILNKRHLPIFNCKDAQIDNAAAFGVRLSYKGNKPE